jgi:hypothetical protein
MVDWVNSGMFLEAMLDNNTATPLDPQHHFVTTSALELTQRFGGATFVAAGLCDSANRKGHTWHTLFEVYIEYSRVLATYGGTRRAEAMTFLRECAQADLRLVRDTLTAKLMHCDPAGQSFGFLIAFDCEGVSRIKERMKLTADAVMLQRALGIQPTDKTPLAFTGVYEADQGGAEKARGRDSPYPDGASSRSSSPAAERRADGYSRRDEARASRRDSDDSRQGRGRDARDDRSQSPGRDLPGARSSLVQWNTSRTKFTIGVEGGRQTSVDAEAMAAHYGVPIESKCWPVLISTKPENARLSLCCQWGKKDHESEDSAAHVLKGFDAAQARARFTREASHDTRPSERRDRSASRSPTASRQPKKGKASPRPRSPAPTPDFRGSAARK